MTLRRSGWLGNRAFAALTDSRTGRTEKYVCLRCHQETDADPDAFLAHDCEAPKAKAEPAKKARKTT